MTAIKNANDQLNALNNSLYCISRFLWIQIDSSMPSSNISVINEAMEVGKLALEIDTLDEESGVKSVDVFYQISASNGESL